MTDSLTHSMLATTSVGHAGCACHSQQRGQIDLLTVYVSLQAKIMVCSKLDKKQKVDSENRKFKTEWTDKYAFVLPLGSTKPMCLICNETVALVKSGNVKRHYETKYAHFEQNYPQNSEARARKINQLQSSYQATCSVIVRSATQQERAYLNILL